MKKLLIFLCLVLCPLSALAEDYFAEPCAKAGIPKALAIAIARQESDLHPFVVNVAGHDLRADNAAQALDYIRRAEEGGKSYDVGLMQINNQWFPRLGITAEELLDPARNVEIGVQILADEVKRHGMTWLAVGKYHSPNLERGRQYAWRVYRHLGSNNDAEALSATGKTSKNGTDILPYRSGIWRASGIERKGRLITFGVREESVPRQQSGEQGGSAGPERVAEDER